MGFRITCFILKIIASTIIYLVMSFSEKKNILIIIDSLQRGGAETMLINLLPNLNIFFNTVLVTLSNESHFSEDQTKSYARYNLRHNSSKDFPRSICRLKKIIKEHSPVLVHAQLYFSTIIGRMATPNKIPFVFSIHSFLSKDAFQANKLSLYLERLTYNKRQTIISVSETVFKDYEAHIKVEGRHYILNNFVTNAFFEKQYDFRNHNLSSIKLVSVGNLKEVKNYKFLLEVIKELKDKIFVSLDIIGEGHLKHDLQNYITIHQLPVKLLGSRSDVDALLPNYDGIIMCSLHEGFGNAPVEAMAIGLPLILNDLDVMKEMAKGNATFYKCNDVDALAKIILEYEDNKETLLKLSEQGKIIARKFYSQDSYFIQIKKIYDQLIAGK